MIKIPIDPVSTPLQVVLEHLDGTADDSFDVYICDGTNWVYLGSYDDKDPAGDTEAWNTTTLSIPSSVYNLIAGNSYVCLKLCATGQKWGSWSTFGQVAFEEICIEGWEYVIPEVPYGTIAATSAGVLGLFAYAVRKKKLF